MTSYEERRRFRRIPINIPVGIYLPDNPSALDAEITDISLGGAFVEASIPLPVGENVLVEIRFRDTILVKGTVVTHDELDSKIPDTAPEASKVRWMTKQGKPGFGIEFSNLASDKREFIEKLMRYHESLLKAGIKS